MTERILKLQNRLRQPLPGLEAHLRMAPATRRWYGGAPNGARQAGVLLALFLKNGEEHLVFIERNANDRDQHGGQVSFPGGKAEPTDGTMLDTALREAEEEVGISKKDVKILGGLTDLYIPVSNFQVHPFVGYLDYRPEFLLQAEEVNEVLEFPLSHFENPEHRRVTNIRIAPQLTLQNVPCFDLGGRVLWGATAMMLNELMEIMRGT